MDPMMFDTMKLTVDAPPAELAAEYAPEVVDELEEVLGIVKAAAAARARWRAVLEPNPTGAGSEVKKALAADVQAVDEGKPPVALAKVIESRPARESEARAKASYAELRVGRWNASGHERVGRKSRTRMAGLRDAAANECRRAAEAAVKAVEGLNGEAARLRAALGDLAAMDAACERWRLLSALHGWCTWESINDARGRWDPDYWDQLWPVQAATPAEQVDDPIMQARAIGDSDVRRQLEQWQAARVDPGVMAAQRRAAMAGGGGVW